MAQIAGRGMPTWVASAALQTCWLRSALSVGENERARAAHRIRVAELPACPSGRRRAALAELALLATARPDQAHRETLVAADSFRRHLEKLRRQVPAAAPAARALQLQRIATWWSRLGNDCADLAREALAATATGEAPSDRDLLQPLPRRGELPAGMTPVITQEEAQMALEEEE